MKYVSILHSPFDISFKYFCLQSYRFDFRCDPKGDQVSWDILQSNPEMPDPYLGSLAAREQKSVIAHLSYVLSQKQVVESIRTLAYVDHWAQQWPSTDSDEYLAPWAVVARLDSSFTLKIEKRLLILIRSCKNLHSLALSNVILQDHHFKVLRLCKSIVSLRLHLCVTVPDCLTNSEDPWMGCLPSVANLTMTFSTNGHFNQWSLLGFCPRLLFLRIHSVEKRGTRFPSAGFRARINPFTMLERVVLTNIPQRSLVHLAVWLDAVSRPTIPLTHLSITLIDGGACRENLFTLVNALARAPNLVTLSIDGLRYVQPDLISRIATCCPRLQALVLIYWGQKRKRAPHKAIPWPLPSYEYIPLFANFHELRHFGWNFRLYDWDYAPKHLAKMEENLYDQEEDDYISEYEDYIGPDKSLAKLMAVSIPTLESIVIHPDYRLNSLYRILRAGDGSLVDVQTDQEVPEYIRTKIRSIVPDSMSPWTGDDWKFSLAELKERQR